MASKQEQLYELVEPVATSLGCVLWGLEYLTQGRQSTVRIFIEKEDGVTLEDCERVSRQVSSVFDVEDPLAEHYTLEVSSPGMDRALYTRDQYALYLGEQVALKLRSPIDGRRKFKGTLRALEDQNVLVVVDDQEYLLPFVAIEKANIVPSF